ncbi:hypothetical protein [Virgisporangium ochraceum]|uniref:Uncharacterized protein n=1 Tax=Virgisporangium ochraceum TaxID=65505 RepID=A0A8J4EFK8_9ACTN|nr:hypothetical protein [Virgisporangium ochraceum]GIJ72748.1 hypothetical protein Voc01_076650 [Virgisporangium ochraceum]
MLLDDLSEYDIRHLSGHLVRAGRSDDLHRLLWLSGDSPSHAWYEAKERIADVDGFSADLRQAWHDAESGDGELAVRLVRQVRCLLLTVSARGFATSLPARLVPLLVDAGLLPLDLALGHTRLMSDDDRVLAQCDLVTRLPARRQVEQLPELIELVQAQRLDPGYMSRHVADAADRLADPARAADLVRAIPRVVVRVAAMAKLAHRLPGPAGAALVRTAVQTARTLPQDRDEALAAVAGQLSDVRQALEIARDIGDVGWRALVFAATGLPGMAEAALAELGQGRFVATSTMDSARRAIVEHLPPAQALTVAREIRFWRERIDALATVAHRVPAGERGAIWAEAFAAAPQGYDDRADALRQLAAHMPPPERGTVLAEALTAARQISPDNQGYRGQLLASIVPLLPAEDRAAVSVEATACARSATTSRSRAWTLTVVAQHLPEDLRRPVLVEALAQARAFDDLPALARSVLTVVGALPESVAASALAWALPIVRATTSPDDRARLLATVATLVPTDRRAAAAGEAIDAIRGRSTPSVRADVVRTVIGALPRAEAVRLLDDEIRAVAAGDADDSVLTVAVFDSPDPDQALTAARAITDPNHRAPLLAHAASRHPQPRRGVVLREALAVARTITDPKDRCTALAAVAWDAPDADRVAAADEIRTVDHLTTFDRDWATLEAVRLSPDLHLAASIDDDAARAYALTTTARHLDPPDRTPALDALHTCVRALPEAVRPHHLADLAALLPDAGPTVDEAMRMAPGRSRAIALALVSAHLPQTARVKALAQATADAAGEEHPVFRHRAYVAIADQLEPGQRAQPLAEAVRAVPGMDPSSSRSYAMAELVTRFPDVPLDALHESCGALLRGLSGDERASIVADLASLTPVLERLGGTEALTGTISAIVHIGRWFP